MIDKITTVSRGTLQSRVGGLSDEQLFFPAAMTVLMKGW